MIGIQYYVYKVLPLAVCSRPLACQVTVLHLQYISQFYDTVLFYKVMYRGDGRFMYSYVAHRLSGRIALLSRSSTVFRKMVSVAIFKRRLFLAIFRKTAMLPSSRLRRVKTYFLSHF